MHFLDNHWSKFCTVLVVFCIAGAVASAVFLPVEIAGNAIIGLGLIAATALYGALTTKRTD